MIGGGSTGLRSANEDGQRSSRLPTETDENEGIPFSLPPATRARFGCWRTVNSKSELVLESIVSQQLVSRDFGNLEMKIITDSRMKS